MRRLPLAKGYDRLRAVRASEWRLELAHQAPLVDALQPSSPHDPVHFDGGSDDFTREVVCFGEKRVHNAGSILEQEETKETKESRVAKSPESRLFIPRVLVFSGVGRTSAAPLG